MGTAIVAGIAATMLAVARLVKNLPKDSFSKFFEYRTTKYQIIARDTKGRVAMMQKQRLVFLAFFSVCVAIVVLVLVVQRGKMADVPESPPTPTNTHSAPPAQ
ncbi:hypothetical protein [Streptomyces sp. AA1529]|uniref:hypothetical protein n=1 Tax=Streptomyces sp. AA1529 TaxID=1203257 RepID=UPI0002FBFBD7|nr:hypothetical protein [Streptomyces sp. AA1529]